MTNNLKKGFILSLSILLFACANNNNIKNTTFNKKSEKSNFQGPKSSQFKQFKQNFKDNFNRRFKASLEYLKKITIKKKTYIDIFDNKIQKCVLYNKPGMGCEVKFEYELDINSQLNQISTTKQGYAGIIAGKNSESLYLCNLNTKEISKYSISDFLHKNVKSKNEDDKKKLNDEEPIKFTQCCFNKKGNRLIIGLSDGTLIMIIFGKKDKKQVFSSKTKIKNSLKTKIENKAHKGAILKIKFNPKFPNKFYTISDDRYFFEWEIRENGFEKTKSFHSLKYNEELDKKSDEKLPLLDFDIDRNGEKIILALGKNQIKLIDLKKDCATKDFTINSKNKISCISFNYNQTSLFCGTTNDEIHEICNYDNEKKLIHQRYQPHDETYSVQKIICPFNTEQFFKKNGKKTK